MTDTDTANDRGRKQFIDRSSYLGIVSDMCDTLSLDHRAEPLVAVKLGSSSRGVHQYSYTTKGYMEIRTQA